MNRLLLALLLIPALASAQEPDRRGEVVLDRPEYQGERASAPIPPSMHMRNEGGSDGSGLCVICAVTINGTFQGVPGLKVPGPDGQPGKGSVLWRTAKSRPGGYSPDKLERLVKEVMPGEKFASYVGTGNQEDQEILEKLSRAGYPIGATMNTGALYHYFPIHHMVSLIHYRRNGYACVVDNNRPGFYSWMPASEWNRRWPDMGTAWAWIWTRKPTKPLIKTGNEVMISLLILTTAGGVVAVLRHLETPEEPELCSP